MGLGSSLRRHVRSVSGADRIKGGSKYLDDSLTLAQMSGDSVSTSLAAQDAIAGMQDESQAEREAQVSRDRSLDQTTTTDGQQGGFSEGEGFTIPESATQRHLTEDTGGSDDLDILGIGLDAGRDIRGFLGIEAQEDIGRALGDVNRLMAQGINRIGVTSEQAREAIRTGALSASDVLAAGFQEAQGFITDSQREALGQISDKYGQAQTALGQGREDISQGITQATGGLSPFAQAGQTGLQALAAGATPEGFGANISALSQAADPLVQERMRALQSAQGAAGLSRSGAGLQEIAAIPQDVLIGLENQLAGRQAQLAGQGLGAQESIAGLQAQGGQNLAGIQSGLSNLLAQQGQAGAGIQTGAGSNLANLASGMGTGLAGIQTGAGETIAGTTIGEGENIASLLGSMAEAQLEGATSAAEARSQGLQGFGDLAGSVIGGMFGSDIRLKKNIKQVGTLKGVNIYSFEANEAGKDFGMEMTLGVIADELENIHPDLVGERDGYKTVNYGELLKRVA